MVTLAIDDDQLRTLLEILVAALSPPAEEPDDEEEDPDLLDAARAEPMDPLIQDILTQAQAQTQGGSLWRAGGTPDPGAYELTFDADTADRLRQLLGKALDEAAEEGDIFRAGMVEELMGKFDPD